MIITCCNKCKKPMKLDNIRALSVSIKELMPICSTNSAYSDSFVLCKECGDEYMQLLNDAGFDDIELNSGVAHVYGRGLDEIIDDHNSVWGGAGPDCIPGRLAAAQHDATIAGEEGRDGNKLDMP